VISINIKYVNTIPYLITIYRDLLWNGTSTSRPLLMPIEVINVVHESAEKEHARKSINYNH